MIKVKGEKMKTNNEINDKLTKLKEFCDKNQGKRYSNARREARKQIEVLEWILED